MSRFPGVHRLFSKLFWVFPLRKGHVRFAYRDREIRARAVPKNVEEELDLGEPVVDTTDMLVWLKRQSMIQAFCYR